MTYDAALATARWAELEELSDLDWDLDAIVDRSEAIAFLRRFESRLCIYSPYVETLYSRYSFVIPEQPGGGITILPDEQAWFGTFHDIPADAVEPTGIHLLPGETMGRNGLYMKIPGTHRLAASTEKPFQDGLKLLINRYRMRGEHFLPVLVKGDLREYEARLPSLHLHRLNPARLASRSRVNLEAVKGTIADCLIGLFRHA
ncbi:hypothetical protein [Pseudomonas jinjuensis]|uniref:Uncharacterized protein n=1 Tax=Pseudomonas jinjuensis TaxID=198616 RepID=A0A1H0PW18_9PSED|nr:hypothetical protein [Pseudomonas jinjuensis]SDP09342.1 hypothetical protein SAMN05216193_1229 [Pseudomonas jinjuensis]